MKDIQSTLQHILDQLQAITLIEGFAFLFGLAQVLLALKNKTLNFYAGIISVSLYIYVFYTAGLFAESLLNIYYLLISIGGIFLWQTKNQLSISYTKRREWGVTLLIAGIAFGILYPSLKKFTTSDVPFLDAFVAATAWAGSWLLMKRKISNWIVLNISNIVAIPLQFYKGMELTSLLTIIYFIIAIKGYIEWRKIAGSQFESADKKTMNVFS
jgi:nicotinamide mononucleotide transporter